MIVPRIDDKVHAAFEKGAQAGRADHHGRADPAFSATRPMKASAAVRKTRERGPALGLAGGTPSLLSTPKDTYVTLAHRPGRFSPTITAKADTIARR